MQNCSQHSEDSSMWTVRRPQAPAVIIVADYFVVEQGNLIFRTKDSGGSYPRCVRMFAAGMWCDVEACKDEPEPEAKET